MFNIIIFGNFIIKNIKKLYKIIMIIQISLKDITQKNTLKKH